VAAAGLPTTARVCVQEGRLVVPLADQEATVELMTRLGSGDLPTLRRRVAPTAGGPASDAGGCGTILAILVAAGMT
jgi:hypothetical protein